MALHALFDGLAWLTAALTALLLRRFAPAAFPRSPLAGDRLYLLVTLAGASIGAFGLGSLNLWLSGEVGIARSIAGAMFGAIVAVELSKRYRRRSGRTAALYALPLALGIAVGRIGCFLAGLDDFTYGTPTDLPWGVDFGDGVSRHPVQLYESGVMLVFALVYFTTLLLRNSFALTHGFALLALVYGLERFTLEFFKPYAAPIFGLTVFQLIAICLIVYAIFIMTRGRVDAGRGEGAGSRA